MLDNTLNQNIRTRLALDRRGKRISLVVVVVVLVLFAQILSSIRVVQSIRSDFDMGAPAAHPTLSSIRAVQRVPRHQPSQELWSEHRP
jgi:hypothetical protein